MNRIDRRRFLLGTGATIGRAACSADDESAGTTTSGSSGGSPTISPSTPTRASTESLSSVPVPAIVLAPPGTVGLIDEALFQRRVDARLATAREWSDPTSPTNVAAQLLIASRDPDFHWPIGEVTVDSLQPTLDKIDNFEDTRDFDLMYLLWVYTLGRGDTPMTRLGADVLEAIAQRSIDNRYRFTDPPVDGRPDQLWFWSENHRIINLAVEHLAGQTFPDEVFTVTGLTGSQHVTRSTPDIVEWVRERGAFGFFEWHSNVYMLKNITPLHMLTELAADDDVVVAAAMALDVCLMDLACHLQSGGYCAPHGRTYKKDKMSALDEDTFDVAKFLFDDTGEDYTGPSDNGATFMCASRRWRPPQVLLDIAVDDSEHVVRERHGIDVDPLAPLTPEDPEAPFGYGFDDPDSVGVWWSMGGFGLWQFVRTSMATADRYDLWDIELFADVKAMADLNGRDPEAVRAWVQENAQIVNFAWLSEANTYTYRNGPVSMASVVDHRPGQMRDQAHAWKAQIDERAIVFTTHPLTEPQETTDWAADPAPGYWTGEASMPRSVQFERTSIHVYDPLWDEASAGVLWSLFPYRDYTHAYFPVDHFDEVRTVGLWTLGRKAHGYIALWSWRDTAWRDYDAAVDATNGMMEPFDLVAKGGPNNVWICEVGTAADGGFDDFVAAVTASTPIVDGGVEGWFESVRWTSPSAGEVSLAGLPPTQTTTFFAGGTSVPIGEFPRHESPFGTIGRLSPAHSLATGVNTWVVDFATMTRAVS